MSELPFLPFFCQWYMYMWPNGREQLSCSTTLPTVEARGALETHLSAVVASKDVKQLPVLKPITGYQNKQLVIKNFQIHHTHLFIDDFDILIYELYTR